MKAIRFVRSVPRWLLVRALSSRLPGVATGPLSCLELAEVEPPALPGPEWVRVKPRLCGICGSDLSAIACKGSPYFSPFTSTPFVLGHELVGTITEAGAQAAPEWAAGTRVVLEPALGCEVRENQPPCEPCARGQYAHCTRILHGKLAGGIQTGYCRSTGGGWSGSLVAHRSQLHRVPACLSDEEAVLVEPFSCAVHAALEAARLADATEPGGSPSPALAPARPDREPVVLVLGCGTIGLLTIAAYRAAGGAGCVLASARFGVQADLAYRYGADEVCTDGMNSAALYDWVLKRTGGSAHQPELGKAVLLGGADVVLDCVGSSQTIDDALRLTAPRGAVMLVGMPGIPKGVDWTSIWYKELRVQGVYAYGWEEVEDAVSGGSADESAAAAYSGAWPPAAEGPAPPLRHGPEQAGCGRRPAGPKRPIRTMDLALEFLERNQKRGGPQLQELVNRKYPLREYRRALSDAFNAGASGAFKVVFQIEE